MPKRRADGNCGESCVGMPVPPGSHRPGSGRHLPRSVSGCGHVDRPHAGRSPHLESGAARQVGASQSSDDPATPVGVGHRADKAVDFAPEKKGATAAPPEHSLPDAPPVVVADRQRAQGMGPIQREPGRRGWQDLKLYFRVEKKGVAQPERQVTQTILASRRRATHRSISGRARACAL